MTIRRTADPWRDTDVIDERAPRFNQLVVGLVALAGALFGWPLAWALMGAQLLIGLTLGRRLCITCVAYFTLIQPRLGEGPLEDSRPPRLANAIGVVFLGAAALAWWLGSPAAGAALGAIVAALALLAATSGFCAGCELYKLERPAARDLAAPPQPRRARRLRVVRRAIARLRRVHPSTLLRVPRVGAAARRGGRPADHGRRPRAPGAGAQVRDRRRAHRPRGRVGRHRARSPRPLIRRDSCWRHRG